MLNFNSVYSKCSSEIIRCPVSPGYSTGGDIHLPLMKENVIDCTNSGTTIWMHLLHTHVHTNLYSYMVSIKNIVRNLQKIKWCNLILTSFIMWILLTHIPQICFMCEKPVQCSTVHHQKYACVPMHVCIYGKTGCEEEQWKWLKVSCPVEAYDISRFYYQRISYLWGILMFLHEQEITSLQPNSTVSIFNHYLNEIYRKLRNNSSISYGNLTSQKKKSL